jgi:metal-dependent amidase/aminoacylase/carboxypeptidase family protein
MATMSLPIAKHLRSLKDVEVKMNISSHGVVVILLNGEGKTILLRVDIDALPLRE